MTATASAPPQTAEPPGDAGAPASPSAPNPSTGQHAGPADPASRSLSTGSGSAASQRADRQALVRAVTGTLALAGILLLGFVVFLVGLSRLAESRAQSVMYKSFAVTLRNAVGPVGPVAPGTPVAVLNIPRLGIVHLVVVEGTQARQLAGGPGHSRNTPLPGQAGVSAIYGRRETFGGPFADLDLLRAGDTMTVTTGQGTATYVVKAFGGGTKPPKDTAANRMVLVTADSPFVPSSTLSVSADLISKVQPSAGGLPAVDPSEKPMVGGAGQALVSLVLWGQALILVAVVATIAVRRWSKWPAYIGLLPVALAVLWNVYENAALLLPNLY